MAGNTTSKDGLAGRYALALFDLADEAKSLDAVAENLRELKKLIEESSDLQTLIRSPLYGRDQQAKAMQAVLEKAGADDLTRRFVLVIAQNRRLFALPEIIEAYLAELAHRRGEISADVTAATSLTKTQEKALLDTIAKSVGGKVQLNVKVDPDLLGGLIVMVGSRMVDTSIKSKLQRLQFAMKGVG
ncbi:F0F1 ATP synthase subunit delta [Fodinicurvata fenggangensis]|uniref:F0F1 ATP synthase subunit delta n=1 Tax=Fodinicurvata fenggangensis TaxID=1121830 RepID=UPI00054FCB92|nr:F0F1 ATP synthase subunit delta [Fodinicurvata fenggangensis]